MLKPKHEPAKMDYTSWVKLMHEMNCDERESVGEAIMLLEDYQSTYATFLKDQYNKENHHPLL